MRSFSSPRALRFALVSTALALVAACGDDETSSSGTTTTTTETSTTSTTTSTTSTTSSQGGSGGGTSTGGSGTGGDATGGSGGTAPFSASVPNHQDGDMWASKYECSNCNNGGQDLSPELAWTAGPTGTMSYAVVMRDLDFMNGFVHWALWDIPANELGLGEGIPAGFSPAAPAPAGCH